MGSGFKSRTFFFCLLVALLLTTITLMSDRSGYRLPARGSMPFESTRVLTPSALLLESEATRNAQVLKSSISRAGVWDDPTLALLIGAQIVIGILILWEIRKKARLLP